MQIKDYAGHAVSGADAKSIENLETALHELRCYIRDPLATAIAALAQSPGMTMGHVLIAYLNLLGTEPAALPAARQACQDAAALPATDRERRHIEAARLLTEGRWREAGR